MTSVRNHRPLLSGNRWLTFAVIALFAAACSPKVRPVAVQPKNKKEAEKPAAKNPQNNVKPAPKVSSIALLLPFGLDHLKPASPYSASTLKEADIALDYYRGFKLALDSLSGQGYNYKLQIFDSKGEKAQAHSLALNPAIRSSDLIVGPVFPDEVKACVSAYPNGKQGVLAPLSPAAPGTIKSQNLV